MPEQITVYKFHELNEEAQERVIERERQRFSDSGMLLEDLRFLAECELENRNHSLVRAYWSLYGQGSGVGLDGALHLTDLLESSVEEWTDPDGVNAHLKPSEIRATAPTLIKALEEDGEELSWRLSAGGSYSSYTTVDSERIWDAVSNLEAYEENEEQLEQEAEALDGLVREYIDRLEQSILHSLQAEDEYQESEEVIRERFSESSYHEGLRFTEDGTEV